LQHEPLRPSIVGCLEEFVCHLQELAAFPAPLLCFFEFCHRGLPSLLQCGTYFTVVVIVSFPRLFTFLQVDLSEEVKLAESERWDKTNYAVLLNWSQVDRLV
jgi:hypothetical protein